MSEPDRADASLVTGTVTFLFTDIEESTRLWEEEPARMRPALARHDAISRAAVESHHGLVVKSTGDGVHAAFDNALDALGAAVDLQRAIADPEATNGVPLRVRCGLHAGAVERRDNDFFGSPVNRAARIMSAAHGGQVLLSQAVADCVRDILPAAVSLRDLGKVRLKDLSTPEHVYQVVHPQLRREFPALRSLEATPNNLPQQATSFIGREHAVAELQRLLAKTRLLTLTGSGGCGKTRLCLQIAADSLERFADGVWMVELAPLSDPDRVPQTVAMVLGLKQELGTTISQTLTEYLRDKRLLLLFDNCEHLLEGCARLADTLVRQCPQLTILASSREALGIGGEQTYRVPSLSLPDPNQVHTPASVAPIEAVQLFTDRALQARADFEVTSQNAPALASICCRLDGIPLAIELAAARVRSLSVEEINRKLDERFRLLTGGSRTALPRQQTLRAALEWSHNLLNDAEKAVFWRLGVFAGGFTMETAQAVAGDAQLDEWAVLDHLSALVDKSLVVADAGDAPRYRLLESARAFALEQLAAAGETADTQKRHALAMRDLMERVDNANLDGELRTDQYAALVLPELDNLRAAHAWATGETGDLQVAIALAAHAGSLIDYAVECADWLVPLQRQVEDGAVGPALAARYWRAIAAANMAGRVPLSLQTAAAGRARSMYQELGQPRRVFSSLMRLAYYLGAQRQDVAVRAALDEARSLIRPSWPAEFRILLLRRDGFLAREAGRFTEALALFRDAIRASTSTGDWRLEVIARTNLIDLLWEMGPIEEAAREASALAHDLRTRPAAYGDMDVVFANWMGILSESGRIAEASAVAREALPLMRRTQDYFVEDWVYLFWRRGQIDTATRLLGASDSICVQTGSPLQPNEARLIAEVQTSLAAQLSQETLAIHLAAGAALSSGEIAALISEGLAQSRDDDPR
jgi:predicted ATPase/class 3 adenylate cyclase